MAAKKTAGGETYKQRYRRRLKERGLQEYSIVMKPATFFAIQYLAAVMAKEPQDVLEEIAASFIESKGLQAEFERVRSSPEYTTDDLIEVRRERRRLLKDEPWRKKPPSLE